MEGTMEQVTHCRNCGRVMKNKKIATSRMKMTCRCGFSDFRTIKAKLNTVNPFHLEAGFVPFVESENGKMRLTLQKAKRESLVIITLEQISTLVYADADLPHILQEIVERVAVLLQVNVCSIYLAQGDDLVLFATCGFDPAYIGRIKLKIGEGITGTVARDKERIILSHASLDPRYRYFPELQEEKYNTMLSFPIMDKNRLYGVINYNSTSMKTFHDDNLYFISIINNLILAAIKLRQEVSSPKIPLRGKMAKNDLTQTPLNSTKADRSSILSSQGQGRQTPASIFQYNEE
jgi:transcriptional regulator with GAF, ATPase, and Fis domain